MLAQLRVATRAAHETLDSTLPIGQPQATLHDYVCHAQAVAAWLVALQPHLQALHPWRGCTSPLLEARLQALSADLQEAGIAGLPSPCIATRQQLQQALLAHPAQVNAARWGAAYVAEGAQLGGQVLHRGGVSGETARSVAQWLSRQHTEGTSGLCHTHALPLQAPALAQPTAPWCGVLALPLHAGGPGSWLVFLRKEQIETIHWGGKPEKHVQPGPRGPRLTPRGSFELWKETVRSTSEHWSEDDLQLAHQLLQELTHIRNARQAEMGRARTQLMAILGHDLRGPLHSISMAARVLEKSGDSSQQAGRLGQRIQSSSSRMQRLVSQVMDLSRLQAQLGLDLQSTSVDLAPLLADLMDEARMAHPGLLIEAQLPQTLVVHADPDRIAQVFVNLLSNARHHGQAGEPLEVRAYAAGTGHHVQVRNAAQPIAQELADHLFKPFKPSSVGNARNRSGLGLGLYIAQQIVQGHGGTLEYGYEAPHVVFTLVLPGLPA